jgi:hypothetical protein
MCNLDYLHSHSKLTPGFVGITINSAVSQVVMENGFASTSSSAHAIEAGFKNQWPNFRPFVNSFLSDRAGRLAEHKVITNFRPSELKVVGCSHSGNNGGRVFEWFHINARGDLFICCDDYNMEYQFGNLLNGKFDDVWLSDKHARVIQMARDGICKSCSHRVEA